MEVATRIGQLAWLDGLWAALASPAPLARLKLRRDLTSFLRLQFLAVAFEGGLLTSLSSPISAQTLARQADIEDVELLTTLLDLGVALGELSHSRGGYRLRRGIARAMATPDGDPIAALVVELVDYHASVYRGLVEHLRSGDKLDYLAGRRDLIVRSSRFIEPVIATFARRFARYGESTRILECGCGSGVYLHHAAEANPLATGIGLDRDPRTATEARQAVKRWGIDDRFVIVTSDMAEMSDEVTGNFDLITLYNNVYYLAPDQRRPLFEGLRGRLAAGGCVVVVSMMRGSTPAALDFSLALGTTVGCHQLPTVAALDDALRLAGFGLREWRSLMPGEPLMAVVAREGS